MDSTTLGLRAKLDILCLDRFGSLLHQFVRSIDPIAWPLSALGERAPKCPARPASFFAQLAVVPCRTPGMTTIDCSRMSHEACYADQPEQTLAEPAKPPASPPAPAEPGGPSYDCMNECVSSLGVTALLSGATTSLGCIMLPPACPVFIGTSVGTILGACDVACRDLEFRP